MFNLGMGELAIVLVVALIVLGPKMLPEIATGLGKIVREIRKATSDIRQDIELDDMIRKPLQELRDAATLPPEELKRRDEARAAARKAEQEAAQRKQREAKETEEARQKQREAEEEAKRKQNENEQQAKIAVLAAVKLSTPADVVSAGGTMIASPPPTDNVQTLTPLPETPAPTPVAAAQPPRLPLPPPPPRPAPPAAKPAGLSDATVIDLQAQLKATSPTNDTLAGHPAPPVPRAPFTPRAPLPWPPRPPEGKKG